MSLVNLKPADTSLSHADGRLSWHLDQTIGGYRAGSLTNLNSNSVWRKVIYYCNLFPTARPTADPIMSTAPTLPTTIPSSSPSVSPTQPTEIPTTAIPTTSPTGAGWTPWYGSSGGTCYDIFEANETNAYISQICTQSDEFLHAIQVQFTNGKSSVRAGSINGHLDCYTTNGTDCFSTVTFVLGYWFDSIQFDTSYGFATPRWGGSGGTFTQTITNGGGFCKTKVDVCAGDQVDRLRFYFQPRDLSFSPSSSPTMDPTTTDPTIDPTIAPTYPTLSPTQLSISPSANPSVPPTPAPTGTLQISCGTNRWCYEVDLYPTIGIETPHTAAVSSTMSGVAENHIITFTTNINDCVAPNISVWYEEIDMDEEKLKYEEYFDVFDQKSNLIKRCTGNDAGYCGIWTSCINNTSLGIDKITVSEAYNITIQTGSGFNAGFSPNCIGNPKSFSAAVTVTCSDNTAKPTPSPSAAPIIDPTVYPSSGPTVDPTKDPINDPTPDPTIDSTSNPSNDPTLDPSNDNTQ